MLLLLALACDSVPVAEKPQPDVFVPCSVDDLTVPLTYAPAAAVEFKQDDLGVVHIYAQSDADLFWAAGYEQARQRLYQIDRARHATRGTLAELDGERAVDMDKVARTFNFLELGCRTLHYEAELRPADLGLGVAFTAGLNSFVTDLAAGKAAAPTEFGQDSQTYIPEAFTPVDVLAMGKRINLGYSNQLDYDLLVSVSDELVSNFEAFPVWAPGRARFIVDGEGAGAGATSNASTGRTRGRLDIDVPDDFAAKMATLSTAHGVGRASNNWAVAGRFTENGKPLMANDPHAGLNNPSLVITWHLNSADAGGSFDVAGFSFPGVPGVHMGHNRDVNWSATVHYSDQMDVYDVAIEEGYANIGGEPVPVYLREETIRVLQADGTLAEQVLTVTDVPGFGVVLPEELLPIDKNVLATGDVLIAWAGFDTDTTELFQFLDFDRAASIADTRAAVGLEAVGQQNWVFGDATGIGYQAHGKIPVRAGDPRRIQLASDPSVLWTGEYLDDSYFPSLDGSQDFIATANNPAFDHVQDNDPTNDAFYYGSYYDPGYRADRINTMLSERITGEPLRLTDMVQLQADVQSSLAVDLVPMLADVVSRMETDEALAAFAGRSDLVDAAARLSAWDAQMGENSEEAALFHTWQALLAKRALGGDMGVLFDAVAESSPVFLAKTNAIAFVDQIDELTDGKGETDMLAALSDAIEWVEAERVAMGLEALTWGDVHTARFSGPWDDDIDLPFVGDESTVNVGDCAAWSDGELANPCASGASSIYRAVVQFGEDDVPELWFSVPYGGVGKETDWLELDYHYLNFRTEEVEAATVERWTVGP